MSTESAIIIPVVTLTRICMVKNSAGEFIRREVDALVWDPNVVRALLDEKVYRNPMVALLATPDTSRRTE
jgi:hypothetical protein